MDARELRIGNYIQHFGNVVQVEGIVNETNGFGVQITGGDFASINSQSLEPIPLTEEWLFKFGFEIGYNQKKMLDVYCKDVDFLIERSNSNNFYYKKVNIKSVHQLQNLYFLLTGEELTLENK